MKRGLVFLSLVFATMILFSCAVSQDEVLNSLGAYRKKECFSHGGLQDYTDYAKYYYDDIDFEGNPYFKPISETDTDILHAHIDDFEKWLECFDRTSEIVAKYDFDRSIIDMQDYLYNLRRSPLSRIWQLQCVFLGFTSANFVLFSQ